MTTDVESFSIPLNRVDDEQHRLAIPSNAEYSVPQLRLLLREIELKI
jgi:hypothetical protein